MSSRAGTTTADREKDALHLTHSCIHGGAYQVAADFQQLTDGAKESSGSLSTLHHVVNGELDRDDIKGLIQLDPASADHFEHWVPQCIRSFVLLRPGLEESQYSRIERLKSIRSWYTQNGDASPKKRDYYLPIAFAFACASWSAGVRERRHRDRRRKTYNA